MMTPYLCGSSGEEQLDDLHHLSDHLFRVMDLIGVSEESRKVYFEMATIIEEIKMDINEIIFHKYPIYIVGSQFEGTTACGLQSDIDFLHFSSSPVIENIDDAPERGYAYLILRESDTQPGYVKLQDVRDRIPQTIFTRDCKHLETDENGRVLNGHFTSRFPSERHGPAERISSRYSDLVEDHVDAYMCHTIPSFAEEWLKRNRPYEWPSQNLLEKMSSYGCTFVGVGHPRSQNRGTEWRISFTLQERELMLSLNETQHKCYVLLKIIKNEIIQKTVGDSITSYHCKTCLFHLIENSSVTLWIPRNLIYFVRHGLNLLLCWTKCGKCPNYFIREENLFDKMDKELLFKVKTVLRSILSNGLDFLTTLEYHNLGEMLKQSVTGGNISKECLIIKQNHVLRCYARTFNFFQRAKFGVHEHFYNSNNFLLKSGYLPEADQAVNIQEEKPNIVQRAPNRFKHYVNLINAQTKAAVEMMNRIENNCDHIIDELNNETQISQDSDFFHSRLIIAALYLLNGQLEECENILLSCEDFLKPHVISVCGCKRRKVHINQDLLDKAVNENLTFETFQRECVSGCLIFFPNQANLVHPVLQFELFRGFESPRIYKRRLIWILVDSKVYFYLLKYLLYTKTNNSIRKRYVIDKLWHLIRTDVNLGHKEIAYNLLGLMLVQERRHQEAFECFYRSWRVEPHYNVAKWYILILIYTLVRLDRGLMLHYVD